MAEPIELPIFDENNTNTEAVPDTLKDDGFALKQKAPSPIFNSWFRNVYKWVEWFQEKFLSIDAEITRLQPVESIAELRAITFTPSDGDTIQVTGYYTKGGSGGGQFYWDAASTEADDGGIVIKVASITTGRWIRSWESHVDFTWWGAKTDYSDSASEAMQACSDYLTSIGGGTIVPSLGKYRISEQVTFTDGIYIRGQASAEKTNLAGMKDISPIKFIDTTVVDYNGAGVFNCKIEGDGVAVTALEVDNIWGFECHNNVITSGGSMQDGILVYNYAFEADIRNNRITNYTRYGVAGLTTGAVYPNSMYVTNNDFNGREGSAAITWNGGTNHKATANHLEASTGGGIGVDINSAQNCKVYFNHIGQNPYPSAVAQVFVRGGAKRTEVIGNDISLSHAYGVYMTDVGTSDCIISGNTFNIDDAEITGYVTQSAIYINGRTDYTINGNSIYLARSSITEGLIQLGAGSGPGVVANNVMRGSAAGLTTSGIKIASTVNLTTIANNAIRNMSVGIDCDVSTSSPSVVIKNNQVSSNTTPISMTSLSSVILTNNIGYLSDSSGSATILSGTTSIVVTHGMDITPDLEKIAIQIGGGSTNDIGQFYASGAGGTQFTINCKNDPGSSGVVMRWSYKND